LVPHSQHSSGKHRVPMSHQLEIGPVIASNIADAVAELLPAGVELLQVTEAAGHGLTPRVNNSGIWQHKVDEPDVAEVVRHLVDEERLISAMGASAGQVALAEFAEISRCKPCKHTRITWIARIVEIGSGSLHLENNALDVGQFLRALDQRMGSE